MHFDIIGDVHGHAEALKSLLRRLDYEARAGAFRHGDGRRVIFLGDLIDRGPAQVETVAIARSMIEAGTASTVMGNHEVNALAFGTLDPNDPGQHFRPRRGNNVLHHSAFLDAAGGPDTPVHRDLLDFFRAMPLWLDLPDLRVVHACWSPRAIAALRPHVDAEARLTNAGLLAALAKGSAPYEACEILLKGPEMVLPPGIFYRDAQGATRTTCRVRWWDPEATTLRRACAEESIADRLPETPFALPETIPVEDDLKPVFFGHYWMRGAPALLSERRACLDFSVAKGGVLCAYRFDGERRLDPARLVWVT